MRKIAIFIVLSACLLAPAAWTQESRATLLGRVTDAQGGVVPDADVVVTSDDTGVKQRTKTNAQGNWIVQFLLPGHYQFSVTASGFKTADRRGLTLQAADHKQIDVQLEIGAVTQSVSVTAEAPLVDTTSATSGTVITQEQIAEMPSMSRVTTLLVMLSPGAMAQDQNQNIAHLWSHDAASQFTVNGGRNNQRSNSFELDGMPNLKTGGQVAFVPPPDALQEFRVQMNAYDASIGRQAGSTVQMAMKTGTNAYHGSLYEFNQNNILNAKLFQTNLTGGEKPPVHYNEYGGTFGGPVRIPKLYNGKEKTFFFINWDGIRNQDPRFQIVSVPTDLERKGDFSQSYTTALVAGQRIKYPVLIYDPLTADSKGNRQLFANDAIPSIRLSPVAQKILAHVPMPNTPSDGTSTDANNYVPNSTRQNKMAVFAARADQTWNNSHKSFATLRWYHEDELSNDYFHDPSTGAFQHRMTKGLGLDHVWTMSPSRILDLRWNLTRYEEPNNDHGVGFDPSQLGLSPALTSQMAVPVFPRIEGLFGLNIGVSQAGSVVDTSYYTTSARMTQVKGNMTFSFGAEYWILQEARKSIGNQGRFIFNNSNWTRQSALTGGGTGIGSNLASFILGLPSSGDFNRNADGFYSQHFYAFYIQNDWRITPRLTLNAGFRWDYETPVVERYNRLTTHYDLAAVNPVSDPAQAAYAKIISNNPATCSTTTCSLVQQLAQVLPATAFQVKGKLQFNGVGGVPRSVFNGDFGKFQPRVGFAYRLTPHTVIRGGVGRFAQASFEYASSNGQNGFSRTTSLTPTPDNYITPNDTLDNPFRGGILAPTGSTLGPLTNLGQGVSMYNQNPSRIYSWEYSLHVQREYRNWLFEVGYTHNKTYNINSPDLNENLPSFSLWKQLRQPRFDATGRPLDNLLWNELIPNPFYQLAGLSTSASAYTSQTLSLNQFLNVTPLLGTITQYDNPWGKNKYDAMLVKVEHRFKGGFSIINAFTWSKLFEDTSWVGPEIAGRNVEHKLGGEDRPFHFSVAPIWEIPVGRGKMLGRTMPKVVDAFIGGWQLSGQYNIQSGVPVVFDDTDNFFFSGKDPALPHDKQSLSQWFDTSQFAAFPGKNCDQACLAAYPAWTGIQNLPGYNWKPTSSSDAAKNGVYQDFGAYVRTIPTRWASVRASRVNNLDLGIYKNFVIRERLKIQYRFETYNTFNHPRFGAPASTDPGSSSFGKVNPTEQNNARLVQMSLKLYF